MVRCGTDVVRCEGDAQGVTSRATVVSELRSEGTRLRHRNTATVANRHIERQLQFAVGDIKYFTSKYNIESVV